MPSLGSWVGRLGATCLLVTGAAALSQEAATDTEAPTASFESVAKQLQDRSIVLLDLRSTEEFNRSHVNGAIHLPATELSAEALRKLVPSPQTQLVIYCANNLNVLLPHVPLTTAAYTMLRQLGYRNVQVLESTLPELFPLPMAATGAAP